VQSYAVNFAANGSVVEVNQHWSHVMSGTSMLGHIILALIVWVGPVLAQENDRERLLPHYPFRVVRGNDGVWSQEALKVEPMGTLKGREQEEKVEDLEGEWTVVEWEIEGGTTPSAKYEGKKVVIKDSEIRFTIDLFLSDRFSFHLNSKRAPKEIEFTALNGWLKGTTQPGIYEVAGRRLRICMGVKVRPTEFATTPVSGLVMVTLEKDVPAARGLMGKDRDYRVENQFGFSWRTFEVTHMCSTDSFVAMQPLRCCRAWTSPNADFAKPSKSRGGRLGFRFSNR
jgi:uncharacterized protein (TIGR03067 family)